MKDGTIHLAYADDHLVMRKGLIELFNTLNDIKVVVDAGNGKELIDKIEMMENIPDVALVDINMPEMDGFETVTQLKKRWPQMRILVLTVFDNELYIIKMIKNGANGYMLKSCDIKELETAIRSIYKNGVYHSDLVSNSFFYGIKNKQVKLPNFTEKEIMVMKYACSDLSYAAIAERMGTTPRSVEGYRDSLFRKLNINSRTSLALLAIEFGIVQIEANRPKESI